MHISLLPSLFALADKLVNQNRGVWKMSLFHYFFVYHLYLLNWAKYVFSPDQEWSDNETIISVFKGLTWIVWCCNFYLCRSIFWVNILLIGKGSDVSISLYLVWVWMYASIVRTDADKFWVNRCWVLSTIICYILIDYRWLLIFVLPSSNKNIYPHVFVWKSEFEYITNWFRNIYL
jgi:hypothetical protein